MGVDELIREGIAKLVDCKDLTQIEVEEIMTEIMSGRTTETQIAAFLTALRMKVETIKEITALASVMRKFCCQIHPNVTSILVDTCGTGGDSVKTFNISTVAAFIAAGAGIPIAKHGNRSVTSCCGSADLLENLGLNLKMTPASVEKSIEEVGIGFMFAPTFHPASKYAIGPRREIGIRTIFNILGPLTNPANAKAQLLGVYEESLTEPLAHVLNSLGVKQAMVVHGVDGLDEISTLGKTKIALLKNCEISTFSIHPEDLGLRAAQKEGIEVSTPEENTQIAFRVLNGQNNNSGGEYDPKRDIALVNAAAAIYLGEKADTIEEGMTVAKESIRCGAAYKKLKSLIKFSGGSMLKLEELEKHA